jgi:autotransporter-associated beta strand protein
MSVTFSPTTASMSIASVRNDTHYPLPSGLVTLAGTSSGNVVAGSFTKELHQWAPNLNVAKDGSSDWTVQGVISDHVTALTVNDGTLTLAAVNNYGGATTVNGGRLLVNGSISSASSATVNGGGTLGGTGSIGRPVTVNAGGTVAPGVSTGILTVNNNVTFAAGSSLAIEIDNGQAPVCDRVAVSGTLNISGATLDVQPIAMTPGTYYVVATYGSLTGNFAGISGLGGLAEIVYDYNGGTAIAIRVPDLTLFMFR